MRVSGCRHVCSLLVLALLVTGTASLAHARHWRHERDHERDVASGNSRHQEHGIGGIFAVSIDEMVRSCSDQAAALRILPSDSVVQTLRPNQSQHAALE